ncbi:MAG: PxxKW family cysteine-rich protein [bacterium]|nr:PxxKW family cysteine-rich protein [bacterium]
MNSRLIVKIGKQEFMKSFCVGECAGCPKQFTPVPSEDGKTFCRAYLDPATKWTGKTCPFMYKSPVEKEQKINPAKASRRMVRRASQVVAVATGSKESGKKK